MLNHSCIPCRIKKIRCDAEYPCLNCIRKGTQDECHPSLRKGRTRKARGSTGGSEAAPLQQGDAQSSRSGDQDPSPLSSASGVGASTSSLVSETASAQYETLLSLAREALGDVQTCTSLIENVFYWKVQSIIHSCIELGPAVEDIKIIFSDSASGQISSERIIMCMMIVSLSWQYFPRDGSIPIHNLNLIDGKLTHRFRQKLLWELSIKYVRHQMNDTNLQPSLQHLQTLILLLVYDQSEPVFRDQMFDHAVRVAKQLRLNSIETNDGSIEEELKVRVWWLLVSRSWFTSLATSSYAIHPNHFTTRMPKEIRALDVLPKQKINTLDYSALTFSLSLIPLADVVRRLVDERLVKASNYSQIVEETFERYWSALPWEYDTMTHSHTGETIIDNLNSRTISERWTLYQLIFHAYLDLSQFDPSKQMPESCLSLATHILCIQREVDRFCFVLNSLRMNVTNIVKASYILILHLMQNPRPSSITRSITLGQIHQGLHLCKGSRAARPDDFTLMKELLEREEKQNGKRSRLSRPDQPSTSIPTSSAQLFDNSMNIAFPDLSSHALSQDITPYSFNAIGVVPSPPSQAQEDTPSSDLSWTSFLPSDAAVYPMFQTDTISNEWANAFQSLMAMDTEQEDPPEI